MEIWSLNQQIFSFRKQIDYLRRSLESDTCAQVLSILVIVLLVGNDFLDLANNSAGKSFKIIFGLIIMAIIPYVIHKSMIQNKQMNETVRLEKKNVKKTVQKNLKLFQSKMVS